MSRFRRFVRSIAKPAAMVGVVGTLSLGLVITTPANAQAFDMGDTITKEAPRIFGAVKTVAPVVGEAAFQVATSVTPVGWGIKLGRLALLAFSTSDLWMPYVTGAFGQGDPVTTPGPYATPNPNFEISALTTTSNGFIITIKNNGPTASGTTVSSALQCTNSTTGAVTGPFASTNTVSNVAGGGGTTTITRVCGTGAGPSAGAAYPPCGFDVPGLAACTTKTATSGPKNVSVFGSWVTTTGAFDPRGANVGYQGQVECIDGSGLKTWITGPTISGNAGGVQMPSCAAAGKGHGTGVQKVIAFKPDGGTQTVWDVPVAPMDPNAPLCDPGLSGSGCTLEVLKDDQPCVSGDVECEQWSSEQSKDPTRWKCRFGPYTLPMTACKMLEQAYRPGGALTTDLNIDGDPATQDNTNYAGQPVPQPAPAPVTTAPGTGGQPVPGGAGQTTPSADSESKQCFPQGWSALNPVEWVVKPVGCALRSAFIPSNSVVQAQSTRIQTKINTVGFASIANAWTGTFQSVGGSGGCSGPTVHFTFGSVDQSMQPFNACAQPMSTVAGITNAVSSIIIVLTGGLGIMRAIGTGFGFNFSFGKGGGSE